MLVHPKIDWYFQQNIFDALPNKKFGQNSGAKDF